MTKRAAFLAAARSYLGTRFHHQGRLPGVGLDCAGVVVCAARAAGIGIADQADYARVPLGGGFLRAVVAHCDRIGLHETQPGDLMMFAWDAEPQHLAIVTAIEPQVMILHAYTQVRQVVEHRYDDAWRGRLRGCWRLRGMD